jgi:hypothetical protein
LIAATESDQLKRPLGWRLALCTLFVATTVCGYIYLLLAVLVSPDVASDWISATVPVSQIDVIGITLDFPGGIFVTMTLLLGCLATAIFLAFAVLEESFSTAIGDALLRLPVDRVLVLAMPYLNLVEERIEHGDPLPDDFDVGAPGAYSTGDASRADQSSSAPATVMSANQLPRS